MSAQIEGIQQAIAIYADKSAKHWPLEKIVSARRHLACLLFAFANEVGDAKRELNESEYLRKSEYAKIKRRILESQVAEKAKQNISAADAAAESDDEYLKLRKAELDSDAIYEGLRILLKAAQDVLSAMQQQISSLKVEKSLEMSGQGSQQS